ncbi:MAG: DUF4197 domain-containing protein [Saprospiraceae bacterium]|nr:DUF4197 domain-containing protein [Saprospiraceae bacterium]
MFRLSILILLVITFSSSTEAQRLGDLIGKAKKVLSGEKLTEEEVGAGLKEALNVGTGQAVDFLSAEDGYHTSIYKILLPEEAQGVVRKLSMVPGFGNLETNLVERMNRGAELAAAQAKPIFLGAIKALTFQYVMKILSGERDAATRYLELKTYDQLYDQFLPIIRSALDEVNATDLWRDAVTAYNKLPLVKKTNPELDDHVTDKALFGMFGLIEKKEEGIRSDVNQRSSDLLRKVFAQQDK